MRPISIKQKRVYKSLTFFQDCLKSDFLQKDLDSSYQYSIILLCNLICIFDVMGKGKIGVFDSWYGWLTILKEIIKKLPQYDYCYLWDNARAPYWSRSFETIYQYTWECVQKLFAMDCNLVILACNTASAEALHRIQQEKLPFFAPEKKVLGVISPTAEMIGNLTKTNHIGILATEGTVNSHAYNREIAKFFPEVILTSEACPMLVPLIENDEWINPWARYFIEKYTHELLEKDSNIDTILLWCTHYPLIKSQIQEIAGNTITVVSQWEIIATSLENYLCNHSEIEKTLQKDGGIHFFTTDSATKFSRLASLFFWKNIDAQQLS